MKKSLFLTVLCLVSVVNLNASSFYLNPGHGGHDSDDRPTALPLSVEMFYESDGNLVRGKALAAILSGMGHSYKLSRTANNSSDDLALSTIAANANSYGGYFNSLHSNGANASANYVIAFYKGTQSSSSTEAISPSAKMALKCAQWHDNNRLTDVTYSTPRAGNDYAWNGWNYGVLRTNTRPGYLAETWFHDYRPEALRMKSDVYNKYLAWQMARGYIDSPGISGTLKGCIIGDIRDVTKTCGYTSYTTRNRDAKLALNGVKVVLKNSSGTQVATMTTDNNCNGFYGFFDVAAGTYTLEVSKSGYTTQTTSVTVAVKTSTLKKFDMVEGSNSGITASSYSVNMGSVTIGNSSTKTVTITGTGLSSNITVTSGNSMYTVSPTSLGTSGGTLTIKYTPTAAGTHNNSIVCTSGSYKITITASGTAVNPPLTFTQVWNYSEKSTANTPSWATDKTKLRNMDFGGGKLYVVNPSDGVIHVINAQTGAKIKDLDMTGVEGGALKVVDCKYVGGKIIACNLATSGSALKIYVWDNDNAQPRVLLNTTSYGGMDRIGDCIDLDGNLTTGTLYFAAGGTSTANKVLTYSITNGVCATTPTSLPLTTDDGTGIVLGLSPRVLPSGTGKFWAIGQNYYPTLCGSDGVATHTLNPAALSNDCAGNEFKAFTFKGTQYGLATTYKPASTAAGRLTLGRVVLVDATDGWASADSIGAYPSAGLGTTRNTSFSSSVAVAVNGTSGVEMWVLIHNQGIAYFKNGTVPTYNLEESTTPTITLSPSGSQSFTAQINATQQKTITVGGSNLTANVSLALSGTNANMFSLSATSVDKAGGSVVVTYKPTAVGSHTATLTATSTGATNVTLTLNGTATGAGPTVPTLTKVWETANVLAAADARYGTGYNGKVYATDATNKILYSWDSNGCQKTSVATEIGGGFACTCDDNGNILTNTGKWGTSFTDWQIYSIANKSTQTLAVSVPSGVTAGYIYANVAATGNVLSSTGGILYMIPAGKTVAAKIVVKNGAQDASSSSGPTYNEGTFSNEDAVAPLNVDNLTAETFMWRQRGGNINYISGSTLKTYSQPSNKTTNTGFDAFKLKGVEYGVVPTGTYCADGFSVFTLSDGEVVASRTETKTTTGAYYVSIKVEEVSDTKVNIYYYKAGDMAAMYTFEVPGGTVDVPIIESNQMLIYNNREMVYVDGVEAAQIDLYTLTGQKIRVVENQNEMSVAGLQGVYLVVVKDNSGLTRTGKIIVK